MDYWTNFYNIVDKTIEEDFQGNLTTFRNAKLFDDPYIKQLEAMGMILDQDDPQPFKMENAIKWIFSRLEELKNQDSGQWKDHLLWPAKVYKSKIRKLVFKRIGEPIASTDGEPMEGIIPPFVFVYMLSQGYFPVGGVDRGNTNQSIAQHDIAHMCGFISCPAYMKAIRQAFKSIADVMLFNQAVMKEL
jgi:hypothetical protein